MSPASFRLAVADHVLDTLRRWRTYPDGDQEYGGLGEAVRNILEHVEWSRLDEQALAAIVSAVIAVQPPEVVAKVYGASCDERATFGEVMAEPVSRT